MKRICRQQAPLGVIDEAVALLMNDADIPASFKDHALIGGWKSYRELHLAPDLLLIYKKGDDNTLKLVAAGSHSELFDK